VSTVTARRHGFNLRRRVDQLMEVGAALDHRVQRAALRDTPTSWSAAAEVDTIRFLVVTDLVEQVDPSDVVLLVLDAVPLAPVQPRPLER
jgi:hypothetical protein